MEEWSRKQLEKAFMLPVRQDFYFRLVAKPISFNETFVSATLPVYLTDAALPRPDHRDQLSVLVGAFKRLGAEVYSIPHEKLKEILLYSRRYIHPKFATLETCDIPDTLTWISMINHPEKRKEELRQAYIRVCEEGFLPRPGFDDDDVRTCDSFIKDEPYEEEKPPRWINSSCDVLKVVFGPAADACMHILCSCDSMIKTVPVDQRASVIWNDLGGEGVIAQSSDATAMEDHYANIPTQKDQVSNDPRYRLSDELTMYMMGEVLIAPQQMKAIKFVFWKTPGMIRGPLATSVCSRIGDSKTMKDLFRNILNGYRRLKMRHFGYVLVNAILCSGEMNTSFKNTSSMYIMANYAQYDISGGKIIYAKTKNEGDDSLGVYAEGIGPDEDWWRRHGWVVKVEFSGAVNEASFCGLVFDTLELQSIPDLRKTLAKFGWTNRRYIRSSRKIHLSLLRSKALSMACEYGNVPILGPLAHRLLFLTRTVNIRNSVIDLMEQYEREKMQRYLTLKPWQNKPNIGNRTRDLVFKLQNISISAQLLCEEVVSNIELSPFSLPFIDFPDSWIHNLSRTFCDLDEPRSFNDAGRKAVCDHILNVVMPVLGSGKWPEKKIQRMYSQLAALRQGKVVTS